MTLVLDTSALVALHVTGTARAVVREAMDNDATWCASALAMTEASPSSIASRRRDHAPRPRGCAASNLGLRCSRARRPALPR
ncbi:MAG: hypothetical protein EBQ75_08090 [Actinobacteria bacterium]|nr:hypothetical protein [Actinomycetota bacterium]